MAPGRKRGAKGVGTKSELSVGNLVLAKVKGYPPWPAKISRPEDWERAPDPKKYFVEFFGTEEIGFVAHPDIQAFTSEVKDKLCGRPQTKTVKYFAKAVNQICEEFEAIQCKSSSSVGDDTDNQDLGCEAPSVDQVASKVNLKVETDREGPNCKTKIEGLGEQGYGLERASRRLSETDCQDTKPSISNDINPSSSPSIYSKKGNKLSSYDTDLSKESESATNLCRHSFLKDEGSCNNKMEQRHSDLKQNEFTNGHKSNLAIGSKRKSDGANVMHKYSAQAVSAASACDSSGLHINISREQSGDGMVRKINSGGSKNDSSADISRSSLHVGGRRKEKKLLKEREHSGSADDPRDTEVNFKERNKDDISRGKISPRPGKQSFQRNIVSCPAKRSKFADIVGDATKGKTQTKRKSDSRSANVLDDIISIKEPKRLTSEGDAENHEPFRFQTNTKDSNSSGSEDDLPPTKRRRRALEAMGNSILVSENRLGNSSALKKGLSDDVRSPVVRLPVKRRAVRLCDDDYDEEPKTPIHGGCVTKLSLLPCVLDSTKKNDMHGERSLHDQQESNGSGSVEDGSKGLVSYAIPHKASSPTAQQGMEKRAREIDAVDVRSSPAQVDSTNTSPMETKPVVFSTKRSPGSITSSKPSEELQNRQSDKAPVNITHKKAPCGSNIGPTSVSDRFKSSNRTTQERSKSTYSGERIKETPKSDSEINDSVLVVGNPNESIVFIGERVVIGGDGDVKTSSSIDSKILDPAMSMKYLIAAAQAKKRQAHIQNSHGTPLLLSDAHVPGRSTSPNPASQGTKASNMLRLDVEGLHSHSSLTSPSTDLHLFQSNNQHENEEFEERKVSSGHRAVGGSLSGGTEAAVARDSFEGMIETLSRTKESIGRATRLAIDCAKYGIANEVVELLTQKLENEPSFHRRVDLFFLVDSITQCSYGQKGIAGASYIPAVQAALSRLIGAAAPPGASAHENRRQCLKVLRLWLERKILPESVLHRYMNDIDAVNDDASAGFSFRRPSRAERAIDDPIREMEGMLVDEYGSNTSFKLHGLLSSHTFVEEEEEDQDNFQANLCKEVADGSPSEGMPAIRDPENCAVTPSDRRHCILEDVDGELEMEDVSEHQKDEKSPSTNGAFETNKIQPDADMILVSASINYCELLPLPEGSPPLPIDSPPATPPLPTSPLPLPPPPPHLSSPLPPPPPPPSLPSSQISLFPPPPIGPPALVPAQSLPPQPSFMSPNMASLSSSISTSSLTAAYQQPPLPNEVSGTPIGNQLAQMTTNTPHGPHIDASVKNEVFSQQSPCFAPAGVGNAQEHSGYNLSRNLEYGRSGTYMDMDPQISQQQPFLPGNEPFAQRHPHLNHPPNHISYPKTSVQQHPYPPYSLQNFSDGPRQYAADEQWRVQPNEFNSDHPRSLWIAGGRSCSASPFAQEGISGFPLERPPRSTVGFHPSPPPPPLAPNALPIATPISGHTHPQIMLWRPEMSTLNWRPA